MAASTTPLLSNWHPDATYDFTLRVGEVEYSTDLVRVEIRSAVTLPYQHILLDVLIDPRSLLLESLFGQQPIKFIIRLKGKQPEELERVEFDLMYINTSGGFAPAQKNYMGDQWERQVIRFRTISSKPYKTMTKMVNGIYFNSTPATIISDLIKDTGSEVIYDTLGQSKLAIDQLLIPPDTIYNVVSYLDRTYGVFDGALGFHCTYDNKVKLQNLSTKTRSAQRFSLYLLATDAENKDIYENESPLVFYTHKAVQNEYQGNSVLGVIGPTVRYIVKPKDTLYKQIDINMQSFSKNYGIIEKNNNSIYYNSETIDPEKRISYLKDQTGYDSDQTFINSTMSQKIVDMSTLIAEVSGNLPTLNLMEVGELVKIISKVDAFLKLGGAYILKASDIVFVKQTVWVSSAKIYLSRTNIAAQ